MIWAGGSLTHFKHHFLKRVSLSVNQTTNSLHALINSGAKPNLTDTTLAKQLHLPLILLNPPHTYHGAEESSFCPYHPPNQACLPSHVWQPPGDARILHIHVLWQPTNSINPHIDWSGQNITSWNVFCLANCLVANCFTSAFHISMSSGKPVVH